MGNVFTVFGFILSTFSVHASQSPYYGEIEFQFSEVNALIESSKEKYKDHYLLIGKLASSHLVSTGDRNSAILFGDGESIEILLPKKACFDLAKTAFLSPSPIQFTIGSMVAKVAKLTTGKPLYSAFAMLDFKGDGSQASCFLMKAKN